MKNEFFETIRVVDGEHLNLEYHQKRYEDTLKAFNVKSYIKLELLLNDAPSSGLYRCKVIYNLDAIKA